MKIKKPHYRAIRRNIFNWLNKVGIEIPEKYYVSLKTDTRIKNINARFMFDVSIASGNTRLFCNYYTYLNDQHLLTALLKIQKELDLVFD
jgi:hypothetical protein